MYYAISQTMILKSSGSIAKPIDASALTKHYPSLRFALKRPIPSPEDVDLTREEDFFHPEEPRTQVVLRQKVAKLERTPMEIECLMQNLSYLKERRSFGQTVGNLAISPVD